MQQTTSKEQIIVEDLCKAEALAATKPLDYFVDEKIIQSSRLHGSNPAYFEA